MKRLILVWFASDIFTGAPARGRKVYLTEETYRLMAACIAGRKPDDFVFARKDGAGVCDPREDWYALCVASGLG